MEVELKQLTENDQSIIAKLTEIEREAFGEGGLNEWGLAPMIHHGAVYIILTDNKPAGVIEYIRSMEEIKKAYLYGLAVASNYRGRGLGKKLLDYSLQELKQKGIRKVELTVEPENERAIYLYKKFGFKKINYRRDEYGPGEDRLIMIKSL